MITLIQIQELAEHLCGTVNSLDEELENRYDTDIDDVPLPMLQALDDIVMVCEVCGWWCETGELNDEQVCEDCQD